MSAGAKPGLAERILREPVAVRAFIVAAVNLALLMGFVHLTDVQVDGLFIAVDTLLALLAAALWGRAAVTPLADPSIPGHVVVPDEDY